MVVQAPNSSRLPSSANGRMIFFMIRDPFSVGFDMPQTVEPGATFRPLPRFYTGGLKKPFLSRRKNGQCRPNRDFEVSMRRHVASLLTLALLLCAARAAEAQNAAAVVQQIHDMAYGKCMTAAQFGAGPELQSNCSCSADVAINLLSDDFKQAIADGSAANF